MKLILIVEEEHSLHPQYVKFILKESPHSTVGVVIVSEVPDRYNTDAYFRKNRHFLTWRERARLTVRHVWLRALDKQYASRDENNLYSVKAVVDHLGIDHIEKRGSVNTESVRTWIAGKEPDVIVSCGQAILGKRILDTAKKCCINRHSSLLPSYRGVLPLFHAYRKGEPTVGTSIHTMERELDAGIVLAQARVPLTEGEPMLTTYRKCFAESRKITLEALHKIERDELSPVPDLPPASYYSFPTEEDWKEFRSRGGRLV